MSAGSIVTMIVILGLVWGGALYFMNIAYSSERKKAQTK